jgi:hypothetical protein
MTNPLASSSPARLQAHLFVLKDSLKKVFPPQDQQPFEALLKQLDRR